MTLPLIDFATPNVPQEYGTPIDVFSILFHAVVFFSPSVVRSDGPGFRITTPTIPYDDYGMYAFLFTYVQ